MLIALLLAAAVAPGKERWPVKVGLPDVVQVTGTRSVNEMVSMPSVPGVRKDDARYQRQRIPETQEGMIVQVVGWTRLVAGEGDGDYHVQLTQGPTAQGPCLIVEVPSPGFTESARLQTAAATTRAALDKLIGHTPANGGTLLRRPAQQCWQGVLFYDDAHVGTPPRGKKGMKAGSLWELHPAWLCGTMPGIPTGK